MVKLYAVPLRYEGNLEGFTFESIEEYSAKMRHAEQFKDENLTVAFFFIEGEAIDREVFDVFKVNQHSIIVQRFVPPIIRWFLVDEGSLKF